MLNNKLMRRDVAIEIIAEMIADNSMELDKEKNEDRIIGLREKRKKFKEEREKVYSGDEETIDYVIEVYGSYLKDQR